jgi:hypothetical protein
MDEVVTPLRQLAGAMKEMYDSLREAGFASDDAIKLTAIYLASLQGESEKDG